MVAWQADRQAGQVGCSVVVGYGGRAQSAKATFGSTRVNRQTLASNVEYEAENGLQSGKGTVRNVT